MGELMLPSFAATRKIPPLRWQCTVILLCKKIDALSMKVYQDVGLFSFQVSAEVLRMSYLELYVYDVWPSYVGR